MALYILVSCVLRKWGTKKKGNFLTNNLVIVNPRAIQTKGGKLGNLKLRPPSSRMCFMVHQTITDLETVL